jgi:hypothetical protein
MKMLAKTRGKIAQNRARKNTFKYFQILLDKRVEVVHNTKHINHIGFLGGISR